MAALASVMGHTTTGHRVTGTVSGPPPFKLVQHVETAFTVSSGSLTVAKPTTGDLLVVHANANNLVGTPADNGSNTWTLAQSIVDGNAVYLWWRTATGTDAASLTTINFTLSGANFNAVVGLLEFQGVATSSPHDVDGQNEISGSTGTTATLGSSITTTGTDGDLVLAFVGIHEGASQPDGGTVTWTNSYVDVPCSPRYSSPATSAVVTYISYLHQSPSGSTNTLATWILGYADRQILVSSWKLT